MENKVYVIGRAENVPEEEYHRYLPVVTAGC